MDPEQERHSEHESDLFKSCQNPDFSHKKQRKRRTLKIINAIIIPKLRQWCA